MHDNNNVTKLAHSIEALHVHKEQLRQVQEGNVTKFTYSSESHIQNEQPKQVHDDQHEKVSSELCELCHGTGRSLSRWGYEHCCYFCMGSGIQPVKSHTCDVCNGTGLIPGNPDLETSLLVMCDMCDGLGKLSH